MTHTSTPWEFGKDEDGNFAVIKGCSFLTYAFPTDMGFEDGTAEDNAKHIVKCVNNHDDLVAACQKVVNNWGNLHHKDLMQLRSILEKVNKDG